MEIYFLNYCAAVHRNYANKIVCITSNPNIFEIKNKKC
tara:strand:- start:1121 stop:1234 length:114 start_codon:yes stop_codon:yes gene_type:complete